MAFLVRNKSHTSQLPFQRSFSAASEMRFSQISLKFEHCVAAIKLTLVGPTQTPGTGSSFVFDWSEVRIPVFSLVNITVLVLSLANVTPPSPSFLTLTSRLELSIGTKRAISRGQRLKTKTFKNISKKRYVSRNCLTQNFNLFPRIKVHTSPLMLPSDQGLTGQSAHGSGHWGWVGVERETQNLTKALAGKDDEVITRSIINL